MKLTTIIDSYIRDQWINHRRVLNEPMAREEFLSGATAHFTKPGTTEPAVVYMDASLSIPHANPVIANAFGEFRPIYTLVPTSMTLKKRDGTSIFHIEDVRELL